MGTELIQLIVRASCETNPEGLLEFFRKIVSEAVEDKKKFIATLGYVLGAYDPSTGKLKRKFRCLEFDKICDVCDLKPEGDYIELHETPDLDFVKYMREKYGYVIFLKHVGEKAFERLIELAEKTMVTEDDIEYMLKLAEQLRGSSKYISDYVVQIEGNKLTIILSYYDPEMAKNIAEMGKPGAVTWIYATALAKKNGYKGAKFKRVYNEGADLYVEYEFFRVIKQACRVLSIVPSSYDIFRVMFVLTDINC